MSRTLARWSGAFAAATEAAPHALWRRRLAAEVRHAADARFATVMTCLPGSYLQSQLDADPTELEHLREELSLARLTTVAAGLVTAPFAARADPVADEYREALARHGVHGYAIGFLATAEGALLGAISVGSARESSALLDEVREPLAEVARLASQTAVNALALARGFQMSVPEGPSPFVLTTRERQIAELICEGMTDLNIGCRLGISEETVGTHARRLYRKLGVHSRSELVARVRAYLFGADHTIV